ncbi:MAG: hypothetical protein ACHQRM_06125 [Bacteroidia bacterium]
MKKSYVLFSALLSGLFLIGVSADMKAQSFRKGSWVINVTEGSTNSMYTTNYSAGEVTGTSGISSRPEFSGNSHNGGATIHQDGCRDPFIIEYGISNRWGIGLTSGADLFTVDPNAMYGFTTYKNQVKVATNEFTLNGSYHLFVSRHWDLSVMGSVGPGGILIKGTDADRAYQYKAGGGVTRISGVARYYFRKRFGIVGMGSAYKCAFSTKGIADNTVGNGVSTSIHGFALEFGLCYRIWK